MTCCFVLVASTPCFRVGLEWCWCMGGVLWAHYWGVRLHVWSFPPLGLLALWLVVLGVGVLFVNCIVDASIL